MRRYLTKDLVDSLEVPVSGEVWIADTMVRGFGLRLWATQGLGGAAFAIRTTDKLGRPVRKSFIPNAFRLIRDDEVFTFRMRTGNSLVGRDRKVKASGFLDEAREWARTEIARLKGHLPEELQYLKVVESERRHRERMGRLLQTRTLRHLVEKILEYGECRGWHEQYRDRLRRAFDAFDETTGAGEFTIDGLKDGRLVGLFQESSIGPGSLRLLRSLLRPVLWNLHDLTNLSFGQLLPRNGRYACPASTEQDRLVSGLKSQDYEEMLERLRDLPFDWRSTLCIELCFHLSAPVHRVMSARWSQFDAGIWWPYSLQERKSWHWRWHRIDDQLFNLLTLVREHIAREQIDTDFWFPSRRDPLRPIANVDRAWAALLQKLRLPKLSMARCCQAYRQQMPILLPAWFDGEDSWVRRQKEIERKISSWDRSFGR